MARLPIPGSDSSQWGQILNDFIDVEHNTDGTLKKSGLITGGEQTTNKTQAEGYAPLDTNSKVPLANLPPMGAPPPADANTLGLIQLRQDLGGSATNPTVPALTNKVDTSDPRLIDARLTIEKNDAALPGGAGAGTRKQLNLMSGSNINLAVADNAGNDSIDVTINQPAPATPIDPTIADQKGDLIVATAADTPTRFAVGSDGQILAADSSQVTGLNWATVPNNSHTIQKDGVATTARSILDFEGAAKSVSDDSVGGRTKVFISREYLNVTDPRIGIIMQGGGGGGGNQGPKLQAAIDMAASSPSEGCVFIPAGTLTIGNEIIFPDTKSIRLLGAGSNDFAGGGPTGIFVGPDLGAGKYAFRLSNVVKHNLENMAITGPGSPGAAYGSMPAQMYGIYCPGPCHFKYLSIGGFGANFGVIGSGQEWRSCGLGGSGYGMEWLDNPTNIPTRNQFIERCFFTNNKRAGIAIADSSSMINVRFKGNGHFGTCPLGIYRYANTNSTTPKTIAMQGVVFENWSFEGCGTAIIWDEAGNGLWKDIVFDSAGESSTFAQEFSWPGKPTNLASIDIGYAESIHWREADMSYWFPHPQISAKSYKNIRVDGGTMLNGVLTSPTTKRPVALKPGAAVGTEIKGFQFGPRRRKVMGSGSLAIAAEAIDQYDLLEMADNGRVRVSRNGAGSLIVGISCGSYSAGELCMFATQGDTFNLNCKNQSGVTLQQGRILKPDPNNIGCVMMATGPSDGPIIGRVNDAAIPNNSHGRIMLTMN